MVQLAVEAEDSEMQRLIAAARARHIEPSNLSKKQLTLLLATAMPISPDNARAKRMAAALKVFGMWKDNPDKPQDGVAYQREVRSEW